MEQQRKGMGEQIFFKGYLRLFPELYCEAIFKDLHGQSEHCHRNQ